MSDVRIQDWKTPFETGTITLIDTSYNEGVCREVDYKSGLVYPYDDTPDDEIGVLKARIFHLETESIYEVIFKRVGAYRVVPEQGLLEFNESSERQTFRAKGHMWNRESALCFEWFAGDGFSYVIFSDWNCLEVLCEETPEVRFERKVKGEPIENFPDLVKANKKPKGGEDV